MRGEGGSFSPLCTGGTGTTLGTLAYTYDNAGRRASAAGTLFSSVAPGAISSAQDYLYDRLNPVAVLNAAGGALAQSLTGLNLDERFSVTLSGVTQSYLADALGSTVALANAAGTTLPTTYAYSPFGITQASGTTSELAPSLDHAG